MTLIAEHLTVRVAGKALVSDVSVMVTPGQVVAVIGPNGAGKSTLLKALCGDVALNGGAVTMGGRALAAWPLAERAKVRAILGQSPILSFPFRVAEVVMMGRAPHQNGRQTAQDHAVVAAAMAQAQVAHLAERRYTTLSGGEQQRVQLARTLAQIWPEGAAVAATRYLLMDEPTNNLDLTHQHNTLHLARQFAAGGAAVFVILHDLNLASQYADTILVMHQGRVLVAGSPRTVLTPEVLQRAFEMPVQVHEVPGVAYPVILPQPRSSPGA
ncbi:MAG: heme ABC transporter ATP-binding protein [Anaerolineae bacterium]